MQDSVNISTPEFESILDFGSYRIAIKYVSVFAPQIADGEIVLPVEITDTRRRRELVGVILDKEHLRTLLAAVESHES